jgi:hypothetical protein
MAIKAYQEFVFSGIDAESPLKQVKGQLFLGSEHFAESYPDHHRSKA